MGQAGDQARAGRRGQATRRQWHQQSSQPIQPNQSGCAVAERSDDVLLLLSTVQGSIPRRVTRGPSRLPGDVRRLRARQDGDTGQRAHPRGSRRDRPGIVKRRRHAILRRARRGGAPASAPALAGGPPAYRGADHAHAGHRRDAPDGHRHRADASSRRGAKRDNRSGRVRDGGVDVRPHDA